jgi:hypothetical protein
MHNVSDKTPRDTWTNEPIFISVCIYIYICVIERISFECEPHPDKGKRRAHKGIPNLRLGGPGPRPPCYRNKYPGLTFADGRRLHSTSTDLLGPAHKYGSPGAQPNNNRFPEAYLYKHVFPRAHRCKYAVHIKRTIPIQIRRIIKKMAFADVSKTTR